MPEHMDGISRTFGKQVDMKSLDRTVAWRRETAEKMRAAAGKAEFIGTREACPACSCRDATPYVVVYGFDYVACNRCGHVYYPRIPSPETIRGIYEGETTYLDFVGDKYFEKRVAMMAKPKVEYITRNVGLNDGDEWLDIGCGGCEMLYAAKEAGWKVRGVETGELGMRRGKALGIPVTNAFLTPQTVGETVRGAKVISLFNVIEHMEDPASFLRAMTNAVPDSGSLVIEVPRHPSVSAFCSQLFPEQTARYFDVPDHMHIFTEKSLAVMLEGTGFGVTHIWTFGEDFYELLSVMTMKAGKDTDCWPRELLNAVNEVQFALDRGGLSDFMLVIAKKDPASPKSAKTNATR